MNFKKFVKRIFGGTVPKKDYQSMKTVQSLLDIPENLGKTIYIVSTSGKNKWVVFRCPNNCGRRVEVNLMRSRYPNWKLTIKKDALSLSPSVIVEGCGAHFWLFNSNVEWALDDEIEL